MSVVTEATNAIGFSLLNNYGWILHEKVINEFIAGKYVFVCLPTVPTHKPLTFSYSLFSCYELYLYHDRKVKYSHTNSVLHLWIDRTISCLQPL